MSITTRTNNNNIQLYYLQLTSGRQLTNKIPQKSNFIYSILRKDRSGSQLHNMLYCLAYAVHNDKVYDGAIAINKFKKYYKLPIINELCDMMGVPRPLLPSDDLCLNKIIKGVSMNEKEYKDMKADTNKIFTESVMSILRQKYRQWLKEQSLPSGEAPFLSGKDLKQCLRSDGESTLAELPPTNKYTVAIHIRRGDVTEINQNKHRYTPNEYYFNVIKEIYSVIPLAMIFIFSESKSYGNIEDFSEYERKNCVLKLDTSIQTAWNYFINVDMLVMSKSSFSYVPALYRMRDKTVVYEDFWYKPLSHWIHTDDIKNIK